MLPHPAPRRSVPIDDDLSDASFDRIARFAHERAGLVLPRSKKNLVKSRLVRRLRALHMASFEQYCAHVAGPLGQAEQRLLIGALTTNVSQFFRENHHFDTLRHTVLPPYLAAGAGRKLRIWSAGCSHGQEPCSIAMTLADLAPDLAARDIRILATDIDSEVIAFARAGRYPSYLLEGVAPDQLHRHFLPVGSDQHQLTPQLAQMITFHELNLHDAWPMHGSFDIIFCRNVLIYFDEPTQERLVARFHDILAPGGWLFLGHSERIPASQTATFKSAGITTVRKTPGLDPRFAAVIPQASFSGGRNVT